MAEIASTNTINDSNQTEDHDSPISQNALSSRSLEDLKVARETRASEALKIKDEQIRILTEQNNKLLEAIEKGEEELGAIQVENARINEENRQLRDTSFHLQNKAKVTSEKIEKLQNESEDRESQLVAITAQHSQLLKLLEAEERDKERFSSQLDSNQAELRALKVEHAALTSEATVAKNDLEECSKRSQLQSDEIRVMRSEIEILKKKLQETDMKSSVEIESLQEQLRVRKEKQYQLLEKLQFQEETRRKAEDQVSALEDRIKNLISKSSSAETQLQLEMNSKLGQEDMNHKLRAENLSLQEQNKEYSLNLQKIEKENLRIEAESRESGEQLREMAEKVFQLLERLKLAELGKTRSMEALRSKEDEVHGLKKKLATLSKDYEKESKLRDQTNIEKKSLEDQLRDLKKHNSKLGHKWKEEAKLKVRFDDERKDAEEKIRTLNSRISFLLNKLQTDEEARSSLNDEWERLKSHAGELSERNLSLQKELDEVTEKLRKSEDSFNRSKDELDATKIQLEALKQLYEEQENLREEAKQRENDLKGQGEAHLLGGGRLRYFIDHKPSLGLYLIKSKNAKDREWLEKNKCNAFMKKASKSKNCQAMLMQKVAELYGVIATRDENLEQLTVQSEEQSKELEQLTKKVRFVVGRLEMEEESKRRTLIKYVNAVKASVSLGEPGCEKNREEVGSVGAGRIHLPQVRDLRISNGETMIKYSSTTNKWISELFDR
jgi:myosin protein heavy chain